MILILSFGTLGCMENDYESYQKGYDKGYEDGYNVGVLDAMPERPTQPLIPTPLLSPTPPTLTVEIKPVNNTSLNGYIYIFNNYRVDNGLNKLIFSDDLNRIAQLRLEELYSDYSHNSAGNYNKHLAENIAWISFGGLSNEDALDMWRNSPGHNANMLNSSYKYTGYAIGGNYAVQVFSQYETHGGEPQLPAGWHWIN